MGVCLYLLIGWLFWVGFSLLRLVFTRILFLRSLVKFKATGSDAVYVVTCSSVIGAVKSAFDGLVAMSSRRGFP